jgi:hypothetical protein
MSQRDYMRSLIRELGGNKRAVCRAYAEGERRGLVHRDKNGSQLTAEEYVEALWADGQGLVLSCAKQMAPLSIRRERGR